MCDEECVDLSQTFELFLAYYNEALKKLFSQFDIEAMNGKKNKEIISGSLRRGACEESTTQKPTQEQLQAEFRDGIRMCLNFTEELVKEGSNGVFTTFLNIVNMNLNSPNPDLKMGEVGKLIEMVMDVTVLKSKNQHLLEPPSPASASPASPASFAEFYASKKKCSEKRCNSENPCSKCFDEIFDIMNNVPFSYQPQSTSSCRCGGKISRCPVCSC